MTKTNKNLLAKGKSIFDESGNLKWVVNTLYNLSEVDRENDYKLRYIEKHFTGKEDKEVTEI